MSPQGNKLFDKLQWSSLLTKCQAYWYVLKSMWSFRWQLLNANFTFIFFLFPIASIDLCQNVIDNLGDSKQRTSREGIKWPLTLLKEVKRKEYNHCCQNWICSLHQRIVGACCHEMLHFMMSTDFMSLWLRLHFFLDSLFNQLWDFFLVILSFFHLWGNQNRFKMFDKFLVKS